MPLTNTEIRNFQGLYLQQNSFEVPDGAFEVASNVQIQSDGIVSKTKGFYTYYTPAAPFSEDIRGLFTYQDILIYIAFDGTMAWFFDDNTLDTNSPLGDPTAISGQTGGYGGSVGIARTAQQNLNAYITSSAGIYKLEAFTGPIRKSGVPPGLDLKATVQNGPVGPLPPDSQTAYRAVFGRKDENGNLLLGAPSDITTVGVPPDGTGLTYTSSGAGPYTVTVNLPSNSGYAIGQQIIVTNATDSDADGTQTITGLNADTQIEYSVAANPGSGTLDISFTREADLVAGVPTEIDSVSDQWFVRWYRTTSSAGLAVSPTPDFALIGEQAITTADITNRFVYFTDDVDPSLIGGQLYTNPNSREGEAQANTRAPSAQDITLYNTYLFYANVETRQFISLQLIFSVFSNIPYEFYIKLGATTETFIGSSSGVRNRTTAATSVSGTGTVTITYNSHGASNGWTVYLSNVNGSIPSAVYTISNVTVNTFDISSPGNTATALDFEFVTNGVNGVFYFEAAGASPAANVADTAYYLVKCINRTSTLFYANYTSTFDDAPGKIRIQTKGFDYNETMAVAEDTSNGNWIPPLPNAFNSGIQVTADVHSFPDALYFSKTNEPEAVPVVNFVRVGSKNKAIKRIFALRDCLVILKEDGAFVLTGQTISDFNVSTLDSTVFFGLDRAADKINNTVIALSSNQGVVQVTEKSVQIISRRIDDVIQPILGIALENTLGFGHESGRTWYLSINSQLLGRDTVTYLYNVLNQTWTSSDQNFRAMAIGPDDTLYGTSVAEENSIIRQRKSQNLTDYSREFMNASAIAIDTTTIELTLDGTFSASFTMDTGDVVVYNDVINRIQTITDDGLGLYTITFDQTTNIPSTGNVDCWVYEGFTSIVKMAPFHAGAVGRSKQFSTFQLALRQNSISELAINWGGAYYGSAEEVDWSAALSQGQSSGGWGFEPWGLFPWGLADSIRLQPGTLPGVIIRTWVSRFAARNTFVQAIMTHRQACEPMLLQSLAYSVRGYGDRTSK